MEKGLSKISDFNALSLSDRVIYSRASESCLAIRTLQSDDKIMEAIAYSITVLGIPINLRPDRYGMEVIITFLRKNLPNITTEQIKTSFDCAISGRFKIELGLYNQTFSVSYITNVLNAYFEYERHIKKPIQGVTTSELTDDQKKKIIIDNCNRCLEEYRTTGIITDFGNATYNYLDNTGKVDIVTGLKNEFLNQAKDKIRIRLKSDSLSANRTVRLTARNILIEIEQSNTTEVIAEAKRIALAYVFDCLEEGEIFN